MNLQKHPRWYHALHALHFGFSGALVYLLVVGVFVSNVLSPTWLRQVHASGYGVFSSNSFWNTKIPRYPTQNDNSDNLVQALVDQVQSNGTSFDTSGAAPIYTADATTPSAAVTPIDCGDGGPNGALVSPWQAVPIPFYAVAGNGPESRMVIYQTSSQKIWEFDHMQKISGAWQACHGGQIDGAGNGVFPGSFGVMGSGLALLGGQVGINDLKRGTIGHAVGLSIPNSGGSSWPATKSDGSGGQISQGMRFQLDPSLNVDSLGLSPIARQIAKTAQTYGFVVWGTSNQVSVLGENTISYTTRGLPSPYNSLGGSSLNGFPWDKLRALPSNYGQGGETPSIISFTSSSYDTQSGERPVLSWQAINVDECSIPGVASNLAASGKFTANDLRSLTSYSLTCSGPGGGVSRQLSVSVNGLPQNGAMPAISSTTIDVPLSGYANLLPQFGFEWAAKAVHKVDYYEHNSLVQTTTTPPFLIDTTVLIDGPHKLNVRLYYQDGHVEVQNMSVYVQNHSKPLVLAGPLSLSTPPPISSKILIVSGMTGLLIIMVLGSWFGWRRLYPRHHQPISWLISYV